jgi:hypothetical protein
MKKNEAVETPVMNVKEFDVYVPTTLHDGSVPVIGLVATTNTQDVLIPLTYEAAKEMSDRIAKVLMLLAPELYFGPRIAKRLKNGTLTLEQVRKRI